MRIEADIDIQGFNSVLAKLLNRSEFKTQNGLRMVANKLQADAYDKVPNDTGELVRSYRYIIDDTSMEAGYDIEYSAYQHQGRRADGTHVIRNRPAGGETFWLRNTVNDNLDDYTDIITNELLK